MQEGRSMLSTFDATTAIKAVNSREGMIAYAGFTLDGEDKAPVEGLMKVSERPRAYRGEELILTFVVDAEGGPSLNDQMQQRFSSITESMLGGVFGNALERFTPVCLEQVDNIERWFVFEFQIAFRSKVNQKKTIVEKDIIPLLEQHLPCRFQPVEWWPQTERPPATPPPNGEISVPDQKMVWSVGAPS